MRLSSQVLGSSAVRVGVRARVLVPVLVLGLVLGWAPCLQGVPVIPGPVHTIQENFTLSEFLGSWHEVATTTNRLELQLFLSRMGRLALDLQLEASGLRVNLHTSLQGVCLEFSKTYELTTTPGHFRVGSTMENIYVVKTDYQKYGVILITMLGGRFSMLQLYSRSGEVSDAVLSDYKALVAEMEFAQEVVVMPNRPDPCVAGRLEGNSEALEILNSFQFASVLHRRRRDAVNITAAPEEEGSGMDITQFIDPAACSAEPDSGPCFGIQVRYFYNSTSMSCQEFHFGGCMGNQNNFVGERECLQRCRTEAACRLPMAAEVCVGQAQVWAFDAQAGVCVPYKPGYCQRNGNKFYSKAECVEYCGVVTEEPEFLKTN